MAAPYIEHFLSPCLRSEEAAIAAFGTREGSK